MAATWSKGHEAIVGIFAFHALFKHDGRAGLAVVGASLQAVTRKSIS